MRSKRRLLAFGALLACHVPRATYTRHTSHVSSHDFEITNYCYFSFHLRPSSFIRTPCGWPLYCVSFLRRPRLALTKRDHAEGARVFTGVPSRLKLPRALNSPPHLHLYFFVSNEFECRPSSLLHPWHCHRHL